MHKGKIVTKVVLKMENPMGKFSFEFDNEEDAQENIEERERWGELCSVTYYYTDGTKKRVSYDAWSA